MKRARARAPLLPLVNIWSAVHDRYVLSGRPAASDRHREIAISRNAGLGGSYFPPGSARVSPAFDIRPTLLGATRATTGLNYHRSLVIIMSRSFNVPKRFPRSMRDKMGAFSPSASSNTSALKRVSRLSRSDPR